MLPGNQTGRYGYIWIPYSNAMTHSQIAIVSGISKRNPKLEALFDHAGTMITLNQDVIQLQKLLRLLMR